MKPIGYLVSGLVLAISTGPVMFWQLQSGPKNTAINELAFRVVLPGQWTREPSSDPTRWSFQAADKNEGLTVSLLGSISQGSKDERIATFRRLVELRKSAETKMRGFSDVSVTEPSFGESGGVLAARYGGVDTARQRRFYCLLLGSTQATMVFYYEALGMTESQAESRAKAIFNSVVVHR